MVNFNSHTQTSQIPLIGIVIRKVRLRRSPYCRIDQQTKMRDEDYKKCYLQWAWLKLRHIGLFWVGMTNKVVRFMRRNSLHCVLRKLLLERIFDTM